MKAQKFYIVCKLVPQKFFEHLFLQKYEYDAYEKKI